VTNALASHAHWREERLRSLQAPDSWLGLIGLFWLEEGDNVVGSAADAAVPLPSGPPQLGVLRWSAAGVLWLPADGEAMSLVTDAGGAPTVVSQGSLAFFVIEREGRLAVRLRDRDWAASRSFAGVDCFPFSADWQIVADWRPLEPAREMEVPNVSGDLKNVTVAWQAVFRVGDVEATLLPMSVSDSGVFFVFRDTTSGRQSYGAGRFLHAAPAQGGKIVLDFNRAINPPCAFTPFATCPLPPPENWVSFAVAAGEKKYADGH
jgi:uncharacterized protein (DUF1684 family)